MPTYEYKCTQDGTIFDVWQEVGSEAPPCPTCGAPTKKVFRPVRTIFKGSGFYLTDTRAEAGVGKADAAEAPATESKPAETKSETPAAPDPKPAAPASS
ncbi:hypothetical protein IAD21_01246 [Abditibacteriota bacterium]|nr:hypothetical protein IAD21_01246 [Abditibacteriota bacterium]